MAVGQRSRICVFQYSSADTKTLICNLYNAVIEKAVAMDVF